MSGGWSAVALAVVRLIAARRDRLEKRKVGREYALEKAEQEARNANASGDPDWIARAGRRLRHARKALGLPPGGV